MMAKDTFLNRKVTLNSNGRLIDLSYPQVMAIINITPDSFFAESRAAHVGDALLKVEAALTDGATMIDIGAYSSRPGAVDVSEDEELLRLLPVVEAVHQNFPEAILSIDTFRAKVAKETIAAGAHIINDISAGELDAEMFNVVASMKVPYIMMHMKGTPQNMQDDPSYENLLKEMFQYFGEKIAKLKALGVGDIILDPGFGFAKTVSHNYQVLQQLQQFAIFGLPILVGFSRKSMINKVLNTKAVDALNGTSVLNTVALLSGATILRVHDVKEAIQCIALTDRIQNPNGI